MTKEEQWDEFGFFDPLNPPTNTDPGNLFIQNLYADRPTLLRFIEDLPSKNAKIGRSVYIGTFWHWDPDLNRSYPCMSGPHKDQPCTGCESENVITTAQKKRVVCPALNEDGDLKMWQLPITAWKQLLDNAEEYVGEDESIRNFTVKFVGTKQGSGPKTYQAFLKMADPPLEWPEVTPADVRQCIHMEYQRVMESAGIDFGETIEADNPLDEVVEEKPTPEAGVKVAQKVRRATTRTKS